MRTSCGSGSSSGPASSLGFLLSKPLTRYLDDGRTRAMVLAISAAAALLLIAEEVL